MCVCVCVCKYVHIQKYKYIQTCAYAPMSSCAAYTSWNKCTCFMRTGAAHVSVL